MSRLDRSLRRLAYQAVTLGAWVALLPAAQGCSVHASWETGTTSNEGRVRNAPEHAHDDAGARERKRRRQAELDRIDREARERVKQAEREAEEQERAAEEEAERERQQAAAEAEQKKRDEEAAAAAEASKKPALRRHGASAGGNFVNAEGNAQPSAAQSALDRKRAEIEQTAADKKLTIRRKLEQNKSDILVAAERKRNEVQATMKDEAEAKP